MAIPSVKLLSNEAGGGINAAMKANNSLANDMILRQINSIKKQYLPTTLSSEAASKLAYANLMGPQFLAKLLGNESAVANLGDTAKEALQKAVSAGLGQGTGNAINQMPTFNGVGQPPTNNISNFFMNALKNILGKNTNQSESNSLKNPPQQSQPSQTIPQNQPNDGIDHELDAAYLDWMNSPEGQKEGATVPSPEELLQLRNNKMGKPSIKMDLTGGEREPSYTEKAAKYQGTKEEEKETGKIRAKQRQELDDQYQQAVQAEVPMQHLNEIVTNPVFQKLRRDGAFQKLQLDAKKIIGTPEEKKLIGDFQTTALKAVAETVMGFKGRILDKEVTMANNMKISPTDSFDSILGKIPTIETFNEMTKQRSRIASKIMRDQHISKGDALEEADKRINGKEIRNKIEKELNLKSDNKLEKPDFKKMSIEELHNYIGG